MGLRSWIKKVNWGKVVAKVAPVVLRWYQARRQRKERR